MSEQTAPRPPWWSDKLGADVLDEVRGLVNAAQFLAVLLDDAAVHQGNVHFLEPDNLPGLAFQFEAIARRMGEVCNVLPEQAESVVLLQTKEAFPILARGVLRGDDLDGLAALAAGLMPGLMEVLTEIEALPMQ